MATYSDIFHTHHPGFAREYLDAVEESHTSFILPPNLEKVEIHQNPDQPDQTTIIFNREDHTLARLLVTQLRKNPQVDFAAYKVPHPDSHLFELRVHLAPEREKGYRIHDAMNEAAGWLLEETQLLALRVNQEFIFSAYAKEGQVANGSPMRMPTLKPNPVAKESGGKSSEEMGMKGPLFMEMDLPAEAHADGVGNQGYEHSFDGGSAESGSSPPRFIDGATQAYRSPSVEATREDRDSQNVGSNDFGSSNSAASFGDAGDGWN